MRRAHEAGFTLIEVMVIVVILAVLALIAIPAFNRDTSKADYDRFIHQLAQDLQRAKFEAISSKENTSMKVTFASSSYMVSSLTPASGAPPYTYAQLRTNTAPPQVLIAGFLLGAQTTPGNTPDTSLATVELLFSPVSDVIPIATGKNCGGANCEQPPAASCNCPMTLFLKTADNKTKHRIIIYNQTGYTQQMEGW